MINEFRYDQTWKFGHLHLVYHFTALLKITKKNFQTEELPHELFLTTRKKTEIKNAFTNNMSKDIELRKSQLAKIIQSGQFLGKALGNMMSNLGKKALTDLAVPLTKDVMPKLATKPTLSILDEFKKKKIVGKEL